MLHYYGENDTIAAIATAPGKSGIAIVKLNGPKSLSLVHDIFTSNKDPGVHDRSMIYGHIVDNGIIIDDVLVCSMKAPHSYTGEDVVEIQSHGGYASAGAILKLLVDRGARIAEPGEFTKKSFLNGKMDLVQAEAVMEIVSADGREYLHRAEQLMDGSFSHSIELLLDDIRKSASLLELNIDFLHQGLEAIHEKDLILSVEKTISTLEIMISSYSTARRIKDGIKVVLAGKVNSGKSSLFNAFLGKRRAIVNEAPGTTRDWIEEKIELDGIPINLIDTAGIRKTPDKIEHEGVKGTELLMRNADIIVFLQDINDSTPTSKNVADQRYIHVVSKADMTKSRPVTNRHIYVSSVTREGIDDLILAIVKKSRGCLTNGYSSSLVLIERHKVELTFALDALKNALESIGTWSEEIISLELRDAEKHIESILGKNIDSDVLNEIFTNFCIGK